MVTEALERDLARRSFEKVRLEAAARRQGMTDDQVDAVVEKAVTEYRQGR